MTLSMEQFRQLLVDYLYDELAPHERAQFETCLAASEACRRELQSMQHTLQRARAGLAELDQPPPPGSRQKLLQTAEAHARAQSESQTASATHGSVVSRFLHWLRNPAVLGAFSVATVALLVVLNREVLFRPAERLTAEPKPDTSALAPAAPPSQDGAATPAQPAAGTPPGAQDLHENRVQDAPDQDAERSDRGRGSPTPKPSTTKPAPAPRRTYTRPPADLAPPRSNQVRSRTKQAAPALGAASSAREAMAQEAIPRPRMQPRSDSPEPEIATPADQATARLPGATPNTHGRPAADSASKRQAALPGRASRATPAEAEQLSLDELLRRAQDHLAQGRWSEAERAYQALLRRFPRDPRSAHWRKQLQTAQRNTARERQVPEER